MGYSKKVESVSRHATQLKRNLKKDHITHEDINNLETQSLSNANQVEEPVNVGENIVDLINANENDEKLLIDFGSTSFSHAYNQTNVTTDFIDLEEKEFITTNLTVFKLQKEITLLQPGTREWFANNENFTLDSQTLKFWMHCFYIFLIALLQVQDQPLQNIKWFL